MAFEVDDIAATVAELRRRGVEFEEVDAPGLRQSTGSPTSMASTRARAPAANARRGFATARATCSG
jgi:hypothetical protein